MSAVPWWQFIPWLPWRVVATVEAADEVPEHLPRRGAVLVGSPTYQKWVVFDCPCRGGHRIMVTLDRSHWPHWRLTEKPLLSLWPSVDAMYGGQRCHYIIRNGATHWVRDNRVR